MDEYERESPFQPFVRLTRLDVDNISQDIVEQEQNIRLSPGIIFSLSLCKEIEICPYGA